MDRGSDQISQLGISMEDRATQIQQLINNNNTLVLDHRELMQAVAHEFRTPMARIRCALEMNEDNTVDSAGSAEISSALDELNVNGVRGFTVCTATNISARLTIKLTTFRRII